MKKIFTTITELLIKAGHKLTNKEKGPSLDEKLSGLPDERKEKVDSMVKKLKDNFVSGSTVTINRKSFIKHYENVVSKQKGDNNGR